MGGVLARAALNFLPSCLLPSTINFFLGPKNNLYDICTTSMPTGGVCWLDASMCSWMCQPWEYIIPNWVVRKFFKSGIYFNAFWWSIRLFLKHIMYFQAASDSHTSYNFINYWLCRKSSISSILDFARPISVGRLTVWTWHFRILE